VIMTLVLDVRLDDLIGDIAAAAAKIAARPHVPSPVACRMSQTPATKDRHFSLELLDERLIVTWGGIESNTCT